MKTVVFDDLQIILDNYIAKENKKIKSDGYDDRWLITVEDTYSENAVSELMDLWIIKNPMPNHSDVNDEKYALEKAMWSLKNDEACCFFSNEAMEYDISDRYEYAIKQAITGRKEDETALHAALNYVEKLIG